VTVNGVEIKTPTDVPSAFPDLHCRWVNLALSLKSLDHVGDCDFFHEPHVGSLWIHSSPLRNPDYDHKWRSVCGTDIRQQREIFWDRRVADAWLPGRGFRHDFKLSEFVVVHGWLDAWIDGWMGGRWMGE
jgi:hypothetical protein